MYTYPVASRGRLRRGPGHLRRAGEPGEEILVGNGRRFRVLAVVRFADEEESPFVGLLQVEAV